MKTNYILIDYENVQIRSMERLQGSQFKVLVFLGPNNTRLPVELVLSVQRMGEHARYVAMEAGGTNALDFHIAYYIGHLSSTDPSAFFHIISKDTGFDPLIQHLKGRKIFAARSISIDEMPCFKTPSSTSTGNPPSQTLATIASAPDAANKPESLLRPVLEDLIKRKASKPRAVKTLKSTLQAKCGKDLPPAVIDGLFSLLVKRGFVLVDGTKVSYALPPCPEGKLAA